MAVLLEDHTMLVIEPAVIPVLARPRLMKLVADLFALDHCSPGLGPVAVSVI